MKMNKKILSISFVVVIIITIYCNILQCKPLDVNTNYDADTSFDIEYNGDLDEKTIQQIRKCDKDFKTLELCMRCAKITKSTTVYPLCCDNEDKIKDWCHDYINFASS